MNKKTTYVVSGYMRSGTSLMMQALENGGLTAEYSELREKMNDQFGDDNYKPNSGGFYELTNQQYMERAFPKAHFGKLIKCLYNSILKMVVSDYKVVFMLRDKEEIRQSYEAFFDRKLPAIFDHYEEMMEYTINMLKNRKDVDIVVFKYRDVVKEPLKHFEILKNRGWEIDVEKAVATVDPSKVRFKLENLTIGI